MLQCSNFLSIMLNIIYAHVNELCLKPDCSIRVYTPISKYRERSIRVITSMVSVLLEYIDLYFKPNTSYILCWHYA